VPQPGSFGGDLGHRGSSRRLVDDGLARREGSHQGLESEVVDDPGQTARDLVDEGYGVIGEEMVRAAGEGQVMGDVAGALGQVKPGQGIAQAHPLLQGREGPEPQAAAQGWLAEQEQTEGRGRIDAGIGQAAQAFEGLGVGHVGPHR